MADLPITFSGPMVRALLREIEQPGTGKTQTRRVIKPQPTVNSAGLLVWKTHNLSSQTSPEGLAMWMRIKAGDRLYVREHWRGEGVYDDTPPRDIPFDACMVRYEADGAWSDHDAMTHAGRFRQAMHMPKWASRITLLVTDVRVERLQDCSDDDALAEGVEGAIAPVPGRDIDIDGFYWPGGPQRMYRELWDQINGAGAWAADPWVVAYTFKPALGHIDQVEV